MHEAYQGVEPRERQRGESGVVAAELGNADQAIERYLLAFETPACAKPMR
jgi:hypothetical protein